MSDHQATPAEAHPNSVPHTHAAHPHARQPVLDASLNMQIAQLQQSVDTLTQKVETIRKEVAPDYHAPATPEEKRKAQWIAAGAGALLVGKIGGFLGFKYGVWRAIRQNLPESERTFSNIFKHLFSGKGGHDMIGNTVQWTTVGGLIGMIPGAVLGYVRGEKIGNPKMYWKHPIESMKVLLGFADEIPKKDSALAEGTTSIALKAPEEITTGLTPTIPATLPAQAISSSATSDWQNREAARRESAAHGAETSLSH